MEGTVSISRDKTCSIAVAVCHKSDVTGSVKPKIPHTDEISMGWWLWYEFSVGWWWWW